MEPSYANPFFAKFETYTLKGAPFQPHTWWRYIDDIFMIWTHTVDDLQTFISYLNNLHPTINSPLLTPLHLSHSYTLWFPSTMTYLPQISDTKPTDKHLSNTSYDLHPTPYTPNVLFHSVWHFVYDAYVLQTILSIYVLINLICNASTKVATISLSSSYTTRYSSYD